MPKVETSHTPTLPRVVVHFAVDGFEPVLLAGARVILRAQPRAGFDEHRALLRRPLMRGREPDRAEIAAAMMAGHRAEAHRHVGRPVGRGADLRNAAARELGEDRKAADVRDLALVGRHAERGVALEVLDRAEALAVGERDVVHRHVVLEIDEGLGAAFLHVPERRNRGRLVVRARQRDRGHRVAALDRRHRARRDAAGETLAERQRAVRRAGDMHAGRHRAGREGGDLLGPHRLAAEMAGQMHGGIPAARHRERIAFDFRACGRSSITSIASTPSRPCTCETCAPVIVLMPSAANSPGGSARESMTAAISMPAACASAAVRQPSSLLVKTAMRRPGVAA